MTEPEPEETVESTLLCLFVCRFDVRKGNTLEWSYPAEGFDLDGVEFKAMPSGLHNVKHDRVFLKQGGYFGLACFNNMPTTDATQRNARMCSIGCLMSSREGLYAIGDDLAAEAKNQNQDAEDKVVEYSRLQAMFEAHQSVVRLAAIRVVPASPDSFTSFVRFMGADLFMLWKAMLLRKRILFYSPVPIEQGCQRVRWIAETMNVGGKKFDDSDMLFYVNVFDIDNLGTMQEYVACTSEKIFEEKTKLWDVYVNNQNILMNEQTKAEICTTPVDRGRWEHLMETAFTKAEDSEAKISKYFDQMNGGLLQALTSMCSMSDSSGGEEMAQGLNSPYSRLKRKEIEQRLGLHAKDANFIEAYAALGEHSLEVDRSPLDHLPCF